MGAREGRIREVMALLGGGLSLGESAWPFWLLLCFAIDFGTLVHRHAVCTHAFLDDFDIT